MAIYLLDTNILLRFAQRLHPLHCQVRTTVLQLRLDGHELKITTQNCIEFWNVATRPGSKNGFGLTPIQGEPFHLVPKYSSKMELTVWNSNGIFNSQSGAKTIWLSPQNFSGLG